MGGVDPTGSEDFRAPDVARVRVVFRSTVPRTPHALRHVPSVWREAPRSQAARPLLGCGLPVELVPRTPAAGLVSTDAAAAEARRVARAGVRATAACRGPRSPRGRPGSSRSGSFTTAATAGERCALPSPAGGCSAYRAPRRFPSGRAPPAADDRRMEVGGHVLRFVGHAERDPAGRESPWAPSRPDPCRRNRGTPSPEPPRALGHARRGHAGKSTVPGRATLRSHARSATGPDPRPVLSRLSCASCCFLFSA